MDDQPEVRNRRWVLCRASCRAADVGDPIDSGFSMIVTMLSLLIVSLLFLASMTAMFKGSGGYKLSNEPGIGLADNLQAQEALQTSLMMAESQAVASGGYGTITPATLSAINASINYVSGPSHNDSTISVATAAGVLNTGVPGAESGPSGNGPSGSITLAIASPSGVCLLAWKGAGTSWFGEQLHLTSCQAPVITATPVPGQPTRSTIGWHMGGLPGAL